MSGLQLATADQGSLVLTDISGYTSYLMGTELEHAQDVLNDLTGVVIAALQPPLRVTKLEGDAIFSYADEPLHARPRRHHRAHRGLASV